MVFWVFDLGVIYFRLGYLVMRVKGLLWIIGEGMKKFSCRERRIEEIDFLERSREVMSERWCGC